MMQRRGQEGVASAPATATHAEREREHNAQGRNTRSSPFLLPSAPADQRSRERVSIQKALSSEANISRCFSKMTRPSHNERHGVGDKVMDSKATPAHAWRCKRPAQT